MKMKSYFNFTIAFSERSLKRLPVNNTHTSYSLPLHLTALSICVFSPSRLSQINAKIRLNACKKNFSVAYANDTAFVFNTISAKDQIFLKETK